jgi:NAD(P)-dependent dehydrogenase (short-subunit alcohol dehydrogenase family)
MTGNTSLPDKVKYQVPNGNVAIVTGAAGGLGGAIVKRFVDQGVTVAALDIRLPDNVDDLNDAVSWWECDVANPVQVAAVVTEIAHRFGHIDLCIANAGIVSRAPVLDITPEDWKGVLDVNLSGAFYIAQACAREMVKRGKGRIVFMSSWVQNVPVYGLLPYCTSKAGIDMLVKGMALELARFGIRVSGVAPGSVDIGLTGQKMATDPTHRAKVLRDIPLGELQSPESVADAVCFLCSSEAAYITGTTLLVDGGNSLYYRRLLDVLPD